MKICHVQKTISGDIAHYKFSTIQLGDNPQTNLSQILNKDQIQIFYHTEKTNKNSNENNISWLPLISRRPDKQATKMLGQFQLKNGLLAVVFGMANLALIEILYEQQKKSGGNIIIVEADVTFARNLFLLEQEMFSNILVISPSNFQYLEDLLERFSIEDFLGYRFFHNHTIIKLNNQFYNEFEVKIKKHLSSKISDFFTRIEFESLWIKNSLQNALLFDKASAVLSLFDSSQKEKNNDFKLPTVLLVSTGPSLRQLLPVIKKRQKEFFIVCADSAYRVLHRYSIRVHLIFTLDSQAFTLRHFLGLPKGKKNNFPFLYADLSSNPQVTHRWQGPLLLGVTAQYKTNERIVTPGSDFVEEKFLSSELFLDDKNNLAKNSFIQKKNTSAQKLGDIQSGGSVATSLFDFLRLVGFQNVILAGQDLAYSNREIHTIGTHHTDLWFSKNTNRFNSIEKINASVLKKRHFTYRKGINKKEVPADYVLALYCHWFEEAFSRVSMSIYNAGLQGLEITGTKQIDLFKNTHEILTNKEQNEKNVLQLEKYWLSLVKEKILANNEEVKNFIKNIKQISWEKQFNKNADNTFSFMNYIGRKHTVIMNRKLYEKSYDIEEDDNEEVKKIKDFFQKRQIKDQNIFWKKLQRVYI